MWCLCRPIWHKYESHSIFIILNYFWGGYILLPNQMDKHLALLWKNSESCEMAKKSDQNLYNMSVWFDLILIWFYSVLYKQEKCMISKTHMNRNTKDSPKSFMKKLISIGVLKELGKGKHCTQIKHWSGETKCQWKQDMPQEKLKNQWSYVWTLTFYKVMLLASQNKTIFQQWRHICMIR